MTCRMSIKTHPLLPKLLDKRYGQNPSSPTPLPSKYGGGCCAFAQSAGSSQLTLSKRNNTTQLGAKIETGRQTARAVKQRKLPCIARLLQHHQAWHSASNALHAQAVEHAQGGAGKPAIAAESTATMPHQGQLTQHRHYVTCTK